MKNKIIILVFMLFLTGCTANYEVTVNEDLSVTEELYVYEDNSYFEKLSVPFEKVINDYVIGHKDVLKGSEVIDYRKGENAGKYIKTSYSNICDSFKFIEASNMFSNIDCVSDGDLITIKFNDLNELIGESDTLAKVADINNIKYKIPYKIINSKNFDCNVEKGISICSVSIEKNEKRGKDYEISFSRFSSPEENITNPENDNKKTNFKNIILSVIIIISIIFIVIKLYKKYKLNKLEY